MTLSPAAREEVLTQTERRENGLRANLDEVATLAHQMIAIVRRGALWPDPQTGWLEPAPVEPASSPTSGGLEADRRPDLGANGGLEPSIRSILKAYYGAHFSTTEAKRLTEAYLAALAAPATPAVDHDEHAFAAEARAVADSLPQGGRRADTIRKCADFIEAQARKLATPAGAGVMKEAVDEIELLVNEYDRNNSDWLFRRTVIRELLTRIRSALEGRADG